MYFAAEAIHCKLYIWKYFLPLWIVTDVLKKEKFEKEENNKEENLYEKGRKITNKG